jgi:hypothetical protein
VSGLLVLALGLGGAATGLWWSAARDDGLDTEVQLSVSLSRRGEVTEVRETLVFDPEALGELELVRRIDPPEGETVLPLGVHADEAADVLLLPRSDGGLTYAIGPEAGGRVELRYEIGENGENGENSGDDIDLGTLNAAARVEVIDDTEVLLDGDWPANEALRPAEPTDAPPWSAIGVAVGILSGLAWIVSLRGSRRPEVTLPEDADALPSAHAPAVVGWLLRHGRVTLADLAATVVDLTARGFVLPFRREGSLVLGQGRPATDVDPHEALVLDWLFADWVRQADLAEQRAAIAAEPERWADLWSGFVDCVEERGRSDDLVERDVASPAVLAAATGGLALLVTGVAGTAHGYPGWLVAVAAGALVLANATAFARRTETGELLAGRWEAFGATLRRGQGLSPHALAYAVTLGEDAVVPTAGEPWPAQLVHDEVERHVVGWREAYLTATSVRGEPSARVRAALSLRSLRRRVPDLVEGLQP